MLRSPQAAHFAPFFLLRLYRLSRLHSPPADRYADLLACPRPAALPANAQTFSSRISLASLRHSQTLIVACGSSLPPNLLTRRLSSLCVSLAHAACGSVLALTRPPPLEGLFFSSPAAPQYLQTSYRCKEAFCSLCESFAFAAPFQTRFARSRSRLAALSFSPSSRGGEWV